MLTTKTQAQDTKYKDSLCTKMGYNQWHGQEGAQRRRHHNSYRHT